MAKTGRKQAFIMASEVIELVDQNGATLATFGQVSDKIARHMEWLDLWQSRYEQEIEKGFTAGAAQSFANCNACINWLEGCLFTLTETGLLSEDDKARIGSIIQGEEND